MAGQQFNLFAYWTEQRTHLHKACMDLFNGFPLLPKDVKGTGHRHPRAFGDAVTLAVGRVGLCLNDRHTAG